MDLKLALQTQLVEAAISITCNVLIIGGDQRDECDNLHLPGRFDQAGDR
jgi:hypothetical protein